MNTPIWQVSILPVVPVAAGTPWPNGCRGHRSISSLSGYTANALAEATRRSTDDCRPTAPRSRRRRRRADRLAAQARWLTDVVRRTGRTLRGLRATTADQHAVASLRSALDYSSYGVKTRSAGWQRWVAARTMLAGAGTSTCRWVASPVR